MPLQQIRSKSEIRSWTVIRGLAALVVVLFHFRPHVSGKLDVPVIGKVITHGDLGVDIFFILSGLVMYLVYGDARRDAGFSYRKFIVRRFARIYPVHFVTTICAVLMFGLAAILGFIPPVSKTMLWAIPVHLLMLNGLGPVQDAMALNFPSWSVSAEMFAYLCFPLFTVLYRGRMWRTFVVLALSFTALMLISGTPLLQVGVLRISTEFLIGLGVGRLLPSQRGLWLGVVHLICGIGIYAAVLCFAPSSGIVIIAFVLILTGSFLLDEHLGEGIVMDGFLYLGRISYSIYMVHALVMSPGFIAAEWLTNSAADQSPSWVVPALLICTLVAAAILYHSVEEPMRRWIVCAWDRSGVSAR